MNWSNVFTITVKDPNLLDYNIDQLLYSFKTLGLDADVEIEKTSPLEAEVLAYFPEPLLDVIPHLEFEVIERPMNRPTVQGALIVFEAFKFNVRLGSPEFWDNLNTENYE